MKRSTYGVLVLVTTGLMGSSFTVGKIGLQYVSPFLLVGIRFVLAGLLMAIAVRKANRPRKWSDWLRIAVIGFFQTAGVMGCIFLSLRTISAGESSILTFTNPLLVVLFATLWLRVRYRFVQWIGVILGFLGVYVTLGFHLHLQVGTILGVAGAVCWAVATILIKRWGPRFQIWVLTAYQMLFGGLVLLAAGFILEKPHLVWNGLSVAIILWLAIMASIVQFAIWFYLLSRGDPAKTSAFLFLAPFFGVLSGWLILGEPLTLPVMFGGALIFLGIFLVNWPQADRIGQKIVS